MNDITYPNSCDTNRDALQETCLASKDAMPFDVLKEKLMLRLEALGVRITKTYEEVFYEFIR